MKRILISQTPKFIGQEVKIAGWLDSRRDHGGIVFFDFRDKSGVLQAVCAKDLVKDIREEFVLEIIGIIKKRPERMINKDLETGEIEMEAKHVTVLARAEPLPFNLKDLKLSLPTLLDWRALTLRNQKIKSIFNVQEKVVDGFRNIMRQLEFTEFQAPIIIPVASEGGAEVFHIDYYNHDAYLAQSPQLYKQIMVSIFERVFTITKVFRAEPSITTRHISEFSSMDAEMGFIDSWEELMDTCETITKNIFSEIEKKCQKELKIWDARLPAIKDKIPRLKMREAQEIIFERTGRDNRKEPDLSPEDEKEICQYAKEKYGSELIFITHYPTKKRPFYTYPDPENPEYTLSFDMLCRGLEIVSGGQRIHEYEKLLSNIKKWGSNPEHFKLYLQAFKYGMPPEGGFAFGLERVVKQILGLENLREAALFPRDMGRIDYGLTALHPEKHETKKAKKTQNDKKC